MTDRYLTRKRARLRQMQGIAGYTPVAPIDAHLRALRAAGWTIAQISEWAQIGPSTVHNILAGKRRNVQHATAVRLAALSPARVPPRNR